MKNVSLSKLLKEDMDRPRLTTEQKKQFLESVKSFGKYGKHLKSEVDLVELSEELNNICKMAEQVTLEEADEWFDKMTINRNMKELKRIGGEFSKTSKDAKSLQERMISLYEDMGHVINRYFEIAKDEEEPVLNEVEPEVKKKDKFSTDVNEDEVPKNVKANLAKFIAGYRKERPGVFDNSRNKGELSISYMNKYIINFRYDKSTKKWEIDSIIKN